MARILLASALTASCATLAAEPAASAIPSLKALAQEGAKIGEIRLNVQNIFDLADPREDNMVFRFVNRLHVATRPEVIRKQLLFASGERLSMEKIDETERLLRTNRFLYDVQIAPIAYHEGVVDLQVTTRDTWTIDLAGRLSRAGGSNSTSFGIKDYNFLGTGMRLGVSQTSNADRRGTEFEVSYPQAFDGWTQVNYLQGHYDDGARKVGAVTRPFYSLDSRWAAGVSWDQQNRIDSTYNDGNIVGQYRHKSKSGEIFGGVSRGLIDGWTHRYSIGAFAQDDHYTEELGRIAPATLPFSHAVRAFFVRQEIVEDRFVKLRNRDQIARTEFVNLGFSSRLQLSRSLVAWGATQSAWLYSLNLNDGYSFPWKHDLLGTAVVERSMGSNGVPLTHTGAQLRYYAPQTTHAAFYGSLSADRIGSAAVADLLLLGGDNGLRGYPLRYQSGERRALLTLEQRAYTDWYPFRLFHVGGAIFYDYGRAWGGINPNTINGGWLADAGIGLRIALDRAAFSNVLHADIAVPLNRAPGIKAVQYIVKTELTF